MQDKTQLENKNMSNTTFEIAGICGRGNACYGKMPVPGVNGSYHARPAYQVPCGESIREVQ